MVQENELYLYLTTRGWKTGRDHEIEIWFTELEGRYYVIAEGRERSHWVRNVRREPRVTVKVGGAEFWATARVVDGEAEAELARSVRALSDEKYDWSDGLLVELRPERR